MRASAKAIIFFLLIISSFLSGCQKEIDYLNPEPPTAEAGITQTIQLPATSFTLTGNGVSTNEPITAYLWSLVTGPNVPIIASPGSATTAVSGFIEGTYIFQLMVIDSAGLTGVDTTQIILIPAPIQTLILQPNNNPTETHVLGNAISINNGDPSSPDFVSATWTMGGVQFSSRSFVKFDLSSIPLSATILSAKLTLYSNPNPLNGDLVNANSGTDNSMFIRRVSEDWNPATTLWQNQPSSTITNQVLIPHTSQSLLDLVDIDVKNLVQAMLTNGNYGFMIRLQNEVIYNIRDFCSSKFSNADKHPKLIVTYQP